MIQHAESIGSRILQEPGLNREWLPFTIRIAGTEEDLSKAVAIRYSAYARHEPRFAETLMVPEPQDFASDTVVFLAESKQDGAPVGTMRIATNRSDRLALEKSVELPSRYRDLRLAEATRLGVCPGRLGMIVKTLLFKALYLHCRNLGVQALVVAARSPLDRHYAALLFSDVFPEGGFIPLAHAGGIPHRVMAFDVNHARALWEASAHPLYPLVCLQSHPDLDLAHTGGLAAFPTAPDLA